MNTSEFILANCDKDVRELALQAGRYPNINMPFALNQIAGRQIARRKLPTWATTEGIVYPSHLSMEQCSSEFTAKYKAKVVDKLTGSQFDNEATSVNHFMNERVNKVNHSSSCTLVNLPTIIDLTGGMGVDFSFMARSFDKAIYVEQQEILCVNAKNNFPLLGLDNVEVVCADGANYLHSVSHVSLIYLDPARRNINGNKVISVCDCVPNVIPLLDELLDKADNVMIKLSPMLDWHKAVADLRYVSELHIVSTGNECKELLFVLSHNTPSTPRIYCVNDDTIFTVRAHMSVQPNNNESLQIMRAYASTPLHADLSISVYLYEPNASIMKAGCFVQICERFNVQAISENSHLFVSKNKIEGFPGRCFYINKVCTLNKKELKQTLAGMDKANITVRNFPLTVAELRKKLKLKDGGITYIFATTTTENKHILIICRKTKADFMP